jgi:predicted nucleic acid-binding Zn ribbon protein
MPRCLAPIAPWTSMGKAADWLREERRKVLGDWAAFCRDCGFTIRWFDEFEDELPLVCPQCSGTLLHRCPNCNARFSSAFAVTCEACGTELRKNKLFGTPIRREA